MTIISPSALWGRLVTCGPISNRPSSPFPARLKPRLIPVFAFTILLFSMSVCQAADKLNVISSTQDLASIAAEVGGDKITVESIAKGYQDPHFVEPKPSFLLKLRKADLLLVVGLQLEIGWLPPLITQSGNSKIQVSNAGYLDLSQYCEILEIPTTQVTRAMGDVHPLGNPHYWLNPENGRRIAKAIQNKLSEMRPGDSAYFAERNADFDKRLTAAEKRWDAQMAPYRGRKVVTYHRSWPNFCERFGMVVVDYVEPKPGIPPTPSHTLEVINTMKRENIKLILVEPYFDLRTPNSIAQAVGGTVVVLMPSVGGVKEVTDYFKLFDYDINLLANAFAKVK
jgi:zinc/manganese transport system substrate-binding protein